MTGQKAFAIGFKLEVCVFWGDSDVISFVLRSFFGGMPCRVVGG